MLHTAITAGLARAAVEEASHQMREVAVEEASHQIRGAGARKKRKKKKRYSHEGRAALHSLRVELIELKRSLKKRGEVSMNGQRERFTQVVAGWDKRYQLDESLEEELRKEAEERRADGSLVDPDKRAAFAGHYTLRPHSAFVEDLEAAKALDAAAAAATEEPRTEYPSQTPTVLLEKSIVEVEEEELEATPDELRTKHPSQTPTVLLEKSIVEVEEEEFEAMPDKLNEEVMSDGFETATSKKRKRAATRRERKEAVEEASRAIAARRKIREEKAAEIELIAVALIAWRAVAVEGRGTLSRAVDGPDSFSTLSGMWDVLSSAPRLAAAHHGHERGGAGVSGPAGRTSIMPRLQLERTQTETPHFLIGEGTPLAHSACEIEDAYAEDWKMAVAERMDGLRVSSESRAAARQEESRTRFLKNTQAVLRSARGISDSRYSASPKNSSLQCRSCSTQTIADAAFFGLQKPGSASVVHGFRPTDKVL